MFKPFKFTKKDPLQVPNAMREMVENNLFNLVLSVFYTAVSNCLETLTLYDADYTPDRKTQDPQTLLKNNMDILMQFPKHKLMLEENCIMLVYYIYYYSPSPGKFPQEMRTFLEDGLLLMLGQSLNTHFNISLDDFKRRYEASRAYYEPVKHIVSVKPEGALDDAALVDRFAGLVLKSVLESNPDQDKFNRVRLCAANTILGIEKPVSMAFSKLNTMAVKAEESQQP